MNDGKKRKPQKHQNRSGFKIQFDTKAIEVQKKVSLHLLCKRCNEQMEWKLKYNKYKKITQPGKCMECHQKNVIRSYMKVCDSCAEKRQICPKCLQGQYEIAEQVKISEKQKLKNERQVQKQMVQFIETMRQRSRRTVRRKLEKKTITWDSQNKYFLDEEGNELKGLHFRNVQQQNEDISIDENFEDQDQEIIDQ